MISTWHDNKEGKESGEQKNIGKHSGSVSIDMEEER